MGSHPHGPATMCLSGMSLTLPQILEAAKVEVLGTEAASAFGPHLPFLLKVLDVRMMLSIQAHPTREQAEEGYAREESSNLQFYR